MKYWSITTSSQTRVYVKADYVKQENGALIFRSWVKDGYPDTVRVVASGWWVTVTQITEANYNMQRPAPLAKTPPPKAKPVRATRKVR